MDTYEALAAELLRAFDQKKKGPPHEEISASMRGEMAVLRVLDQAQAPMSAGEITRGLDMTTSRIAAVLGSLEKKKMIERRGDESDRRRVLVTLTQQGREFCRERKQCAMRDLAEMLRNLGEEDAAHFVRIMKRIQTCMPEKPTCMHEEKEEITE